mgnify:CR=1 FL=1
MADGIPNSIFLQLDGLTGSSTEDKHKEWIELVTVAWGGHNPTSRGTDGNVKAGSVSFQGLSCVKTVDATTPVLLDKMANGQAIPKGKIEICKQDKGMTPILTYELTTVFVAAISLDAVSGDASVQNENLMLDFREVKVIYQKQNPDGTDGAKSEFAWNIGQNKQV